MKTKKQKKIQSKNGITLIALIITIIVLLILAGITIQQLGENGLFGKVKRSKEESLKAQAVEDIQLKIAEAQIAGHGDISWKNFLKILQDAQDTYLVTTTSSQTSSLSSENSGITNLEGLNEHNGSVYVTNLTNYNYEVEIGSDFKIKNQVASTSTGNPGSSNNSGNSGGSNNSIATSDLISDFNIEVECNATAATVSIKDGISENDPNVKLYLILGNNEIVDYTSDLPYTVTNLQRETDYDIKVIAIDKNAKFKESTNNVPITTGSYHVLEETNVNLVNVESCTADNYERNK